MPTKKIALPSVRAVQTMLFNPPSRWAPSWERMPDAVKTRVIEALAQLLLRARGVAAEPGEAVDD
jgi:hypothetical protein